VFPPTDTSWPDLLRELWTPGIWVFLAALIAGLIATPLFRWIAVRRGICDRPDNAVKIHRAPIPYLGGCAIWLAWTVALGLYAMLPRADGKGGVLLTLLAGGGVAFLTGLIDDLRDLRPWKKLLGQTLAAVILLVGGIRWLAYPEFASLPMMHMSPDSWFVVVVCTVMQFAIVLGATNATNLLDGLDGLCSGVMAIISVGFLLLATALEAWARYPGMSGAHAYAYTDVTMVVALALAGAVVGFLPYNFNPARIFMGDAGSVFIGYVMAAMMIMFAGTFGVVKWFVGALFIFGVPLFDTGVAVLRRLLNHRHIMMPDRSHLYNQLVDRLGLSVRAAVGVLYGLSALFGAVGLMVLYLPGRCALAIFVAVGLIFLGVVWRLGFLKMTEEEKAAADRYLERKRLP
jgi:UDP-GlcNAc:undecaprenyl-phosphate/decaprenyl-phosphate GlcNAc-1-phosphate transferase